MSETDFMSAKLPPQDIDAEQSVLGSILLDNNRINMIKSILSTEDFYRNSHRVIFDAIKGLSEHEEPIDLVTLSNRIKDDGKLQEIGGASFLAALADCVPSAANCEHYATIVKHKAVLRAIIAHAANLMESAYDGTNAEEVLSLARTGASNISLCSSMQIHPLRSVLTETVTEIERLYMAEDHLTGLTTGFTDLDHYTSGLHGGELIIVAGRPGSGKSVMAMDLSMNCGVNSLVFALEMDRKQYVKRMLASKARVEHRSIRSGNINESEWTRVAHAAGLLSHMDIRFIDDGGISLERIIDTCEREKSERDISMVVIDYLQLVSVKGVRGRSREEEVSTISKSLKLLARRLDIPVVCLAQLNRYCETRPDKRPMKSDLRESGSLEQDADVVLLMYRPYEYWKNLSAEKEAEKIEELYGGWGVRKPTSLRDMGECIVDKARNSMTGSVPLTFLGDYQTFQNYTSGEEVQGDFSEE